MNAGSIIAYYTSAGNLHSWIILIHRERKKAGKTFPAMPGVKSPIRISLSVTMTFKFLFMVCIPEGHRFFKRTGSTAFYRVEKHHRVCAFFNADIFTYAGAKRSGSPNNRKRGKKLPVFLLPQIRSFISSRFCLLSGSSPFCSFPISSTIRSLTGVGIPVFFPQAQTTPLMALTSQGFPFFRS